MKVLVYMLILKVVQVMELVEVRYLPSVLLILAHIPL